MSFHLNLNSETVGECHPTKPLCLAPSVSIADALQLMKEQNRGAVLICQFEQLIGIFSERDALRIMASGESCDRPLMEVMTRDPVVVKANDVVGKAITLMTKGGYRRLPIVDDQGRVTGMIKVQGIMHYLAEHFPSVIYNLPPEPHQSTQHREGA